MAAGLGFKTFTTGEVLTAGDVNGYLMQGINVFASEAARNAAITSPQEGQFAFTKDTNSTWYYDGAAWVPSGASGDVTGVTAGTGITVTDPTGPVPTVTNAMATAITTAGDLIKGTGSGTFNRLGIGSTGQVLTVSGGAPAWATPASGAYTLLSTTTLSGSNQVISSIDQTYKHLFVLITGMTNSTGDGALRMDCNSNASSGFYSRTGQVGYTASTGAAGGDQFSPMVNTVDRTSAVNAVAVMYFDYATAGVHPFNFQSGYVATGGALETVNGGGAIRFGTAAAISSIRFHNYGGGFTAGTVKIYGVN
jgi:hypothetical protein